MEIIGFIFLVGLTVYGCWIVLRTIGRSEDPWRLVVKWIVTVLLSYLIVKEARLGGGLGGLLIGIVLGLILGMMWARNLGNLIAKPFETLYDGGSQRIEERPLYSMALAKRKRGDYVGALAEVRRQLDRFPSDFEGLILLSEIQAEDLHDLDSARQTIEELLKQPGHAPKNVAFAINRLADWELALGNDAAAARATIQRIVDAFPESEQAQFAFQRMAHLDSGGSMPLRESRRFVLGEYESNMGLKKNVSGLHDPVENPSEAAADYVDHLAKHPQDYEAREKLAAIYADHYQRLDLAADQLEFLIEAPHQPAKQVVRWLNLLADFQIRLASDAVLARQTLERIIDKHPESAAAQNARNRIAYLNREVKGKQKSQDVKLGSYEQNIGLNQKRPNWGRPTE